MTEEDREEVYEELMGNPDVIKSVCVIDHNRIDVINILEARGRDADTTPTHFHPKSCSQPLRRRRRRRRRRRASTHLSVSSLTAHQPIRAACNCTMNHVYVLYL